ncbi:mitochondrial transcription rescue factor 1 isoform X2 [Hylaeus anthracinus]|nr:mitochondrial transcription rescue factor 1 isoform X2 [Hylaeus anthracinus]
MILKRFKSKKEASEEVDENDNEENESLEVDDYLLTKNSKIINATVSSLRVDAIAKVAFGLSRNLIDRAFYDSNIRINGKKILKKSHQVEVDDEIDLVVDRDTKNPKLIIVHRSILLKAKGNVDSISVKLLRNKSLLIEDYPEPWDGMA